jgi:hypothetical protein
VYTPHNAQFAWAQTQYDLAFVGVILFDKTRNPQQLDHALQAVDSALEEYRKAQSVSLIEKAQCLRERILAAKGA